MDKDDKKWQTLKLLWAYFERSPIRDIVPLISSDLIHKF